MRKVPIFILLLASLAGANGRAQVSGYATDDLDRQFMAGLPRLTLPAGYATKSLPKKKDNTYLKYFSGIYSQEVWNCNQAASLWTMFTYEINYLRGLDSRLPQNQYSPMAVFNLLNFGNPGQGVSYFDSWKVIKENGIMANPDFPIEGQNSQLWVTGYEKYYRGMKNRADQIMAIDVGTPEGLLTLKHWINDHLDGSSEGGLANFQIGSDGMVIHQIPFDKGLEEEGQHILVKYGPYVGHAMTFAGYNDDVKFDFNGDGAYTNHIDINGDHIVDMKDWEIGAMLVVNSWSSGWYDAGKVWVMYRVLAEDTNHGGIWGNSVTVIRPKKYHQPLLTARISLTYDLRDRIKIQAGISSDPDASEPERILDYSCFNFQGGSYPMKGIVSPDNQNIEIGLDLTPLLNDFPEDGVAKVFLEVVQRSPKNDGTGSVNSFAVMNYGKGQSVFTSDEGPVDIQRNGITRLDVLVTSKHIMPEIRTSRLPPATIGMEYNYQLEAGGTAGPYKWTDPAKMFSEKPEVEPVSFTGGEQVLRRGELNSAVRDLPFGIPFYGKAFGKMIVLANGGIILGSDYLRYPYVIDNRLTVIQYCGIFPFYGTLHYPDDSFGVTMESSVNEVIVRWRASLDEEDTRPVEFAAKILPDGKFLFCYGSMGVLPGDSWISAISEGDMNHYTLLKHNSSIVGENSCFLLEPLHWPAGLVLSADGKLSGIPEQGGEWIIPFEVTNGTDLIARRTLNLLVSGSSSIEEPDYNTGIAMYPNPVTGSAWLRVVSDQAGAIRLNIYDLTGKQVVSEDNRVVSGKNLIRINGTEHLEPAVYFFRLAGAAEGYGKIVVR